VIYFKCDGLWREQLVPDKGSGAGYVTYTSYGTGAKPKIYGSKNESSTGDWTDRGSNIWSNKDASFTVDVGNLIFQDGTCGTKQKTLVACDAQGDFFYSFTGDSLCMYSVGNPATVYGDIECALYWSIGLINIVGTCCYVEISNLDLRYAGGETIAMYGTTNNHIKIHDCDLSYGGGADMMSDYTVRYGNGIDWWQNGSDCEVYNNRIDNMYDAGISPQCTGTVGVFNNISIHNNIISNCVYSFEYFNRQAGSTTDSLFIYNNTCTDAGSGWSYTQRWDAAYGMHVRFAGPAATTTTKLRIWNNIFDNAQTAAFYLCVAADSSSVDLDYNVYNATNVAYVEDKATAYTTLSSWRTYSKDDAHSVSGDPSLNADFSLPAGSNAIDIGKDVDLTTDYFGNIIDASPDIGACEYISTPVPTPRVNSVIQYNGKKVSYNGKTIKE
jgi:hypothetical protein